MGVGFGDIVCAVLGPSDLGKHFVCLHVGVEVMILFFLLIAMVVVLCAVNDVYVRTRSMS